MQAGRSKIGFPMRSSHFSIDLIFPTALWPWGRLRVTEMTIGNLLGDKARPAHKADSLKTICEPIVWKMWDPRRLTTLWTSTIC
jgi:hypothetical protein